MRKPTLDPVRSETRETVGPFASAVLAVLAVLVLILVLAASGCGQDKKEAAPAEGNRAMVPIGEASADSTGVFGEALAVHPAEAEMETDTETGMGSGMEEGAILAADGNPAVAEGVGSSATGHTIESEPAPAASPQVETPATAGDLYSLQLGSFKNRSYAVTRSEQIQGVGLDPVIEAVELAGVTYYRVLVHQIPGRAAATTIGEELSARLDITYLVKRAD